MKKLGDTLILCVVKWYTSITWRNCWSLLLFAFCRLFVILSNLIHYFLHFRFCNYFLSMQQYLTISIIKLMFAITVFCLKQTYSHVLRPKQTYSYVFAYCIQQPQIKDLINSDFSANYSVFFFLGYEQLFSKRAKDGFFFFYKRKAISKEIATLISQ